MDTSALAKRMKKYEAVSKNVLMRRTPVIIRVDGRAFHTFTKGFQKPFDEVLMSAMQDTMKYLCENIQGCVLGYTQSDEITLVLTDYKRLESDAWFDYKVQKMCSIVASMATLEFNRKMKRYAVKYANSGSGDEITKQFGIYAKAINRGITKCPACNGTGEVPDNDTTKIAIIFDRWFIAPDELNEFCKSIGYENPDYPNDFDLMFDPRVVQFCQQNLTMLWGECVYRGRESCDFRCGFAGAGYIRSIDTSKVWRLSYNHVDAPVIDYVQVSTNKYGYLSVL